MNILSGLESVTTLVLSQRQVNSQHRNVDLAFLPAHRFRQIGNSSQFAATPGTASPVNRLPGPPALLAWRLVSQEIAVAN